MRNPSSCWKSAFSTRWGKAAPNWHQSRFFKIEICWYFSYLLELVSFNEKHSRGVEIEQLIGRKLRPDFEAKARGNFHRIQPAEGWKRRALWPTTLLESSSWVRVIHTSELGCKSAFERPIWKRLNESNFSFGSINPPSCYALWQTHLNDPVLRRPPPLPLEHGVNVGRHGHHHWLWVPPCVHVPLLCVLVDLVMVKTAKRHVCGQDNFWTLVLQEKVDFRKNLKHRQMSLLIIVHFPLVLPLLGRGRLGWWGHIVVEYSLPVASTPVYNPPSLHICMCMLHNLDGDERSDDIDGHICIPSQRILSLSLSQMLCYLFASHSHWARPTNPHSLMMLATRRMKRTVLVLLTIDCWSTCRWH